MTSDEISSPAPTPVVAASATAARAVSIATNNTLSSSVRCGVCPRSRATFDGEDLRAHTATRAAKASVAAFGAGDLDAAEYARCTEFATSGLLLLERLAADPLSATPTEVMELCARIVASAGMATFMLDVSFVFDKERVRHVLSSPAALLATGTGGVSDARWTGVYGTQLPRALQKAAKTVTERSFFGGWRRDSLTRACDAIGMFMLTPRFQGMITVFGVPAVDLLRSLQRLRALSGEHVASVSFHPYKPLGIVARGVCETDVPAHVLAALWRALAGHETRVDVAFDVTAYLRDVLPGHIVERPLTAMLMTMAACVLSGSCGTRFDPTGDEVGVAFATAVSAVGAPSFPHPACDPRPSCAWIPRALSELAHFVVRDPSNAYVSKCAACSTLLLLPVVCRHCKTAPYCGLRCHAVDWVAHRVVCVPPSNAGELVDPDA